MYATPIIEYLRKHGQKVDYEIAEAINISIDDVRSSLIALSARGEISRCNVTRFTNGQPIEGIMCRISGTVPPKTPGRKPGEK